jgi:hypothetical protein
VGKARIAVTLRIREHGTTVRTVRFAWTNPLTAAEIRAWRGSGTWVVTMLGDGVVASRTLCGFSFCVDAERDNLSYGAPFDNLTETRTALGPGRSRIVLAGHMDIGGRSAIRDVGGDYWYTANEARGFDNDIPAPLAVAPGQQVLFTIVLSVPFGRG